MKLRTIAIASAVALGAAGAYLTRTSIAEAQSPAEWSTQVGCTSEVHACTSGSCSRVSPVGEADAGMSLENVKGFTVRVCGTSARPLAGAGTLDDYHRIASTGQTPKVVGNSQAVTYAGICDEFPPFTVPAGLPAADRMVWASNGVTIANWDGGTADTVTVTVCPSM